MSVSSHIHDTHNRSISTLFKICIHFFNGNLKISTSENVGVQWIDSIFLVFGKPAPGKNEISKKQIIADEFSHC
jgi:hypothetical protein